MTVGRSTEVSQRERDEVKRIIKRLDQLKSDRANFEAHWQKIAKVVMPFDMSFLSQYQTEGVDTDPRVYDSTGIHSNELLASGFYSLLTNPASPWFDLSVANQKLANNSAVKRWLADVTRIMAYEIQRPQSGFTTSLHEGYRSYGAYGNMCMFVTEKKDLTGLQINSLPLSECYFAENAEGQIGSLYRVYRRTVLQLVEAFGKANLHPEIVKAYDDGELSTKFEILHVVAPNIEADPLSIKAAKAMPYKSTYVDTKHGLVIQESGYNERPFMAARFYKASHETYGRGPGSNALPDLRMLQQIVSTNLRAAQKMIDPALMIPDQGFVSPISTKPAAINYYRTGSMDPKGVVPMQTGGRPDLGLDIIKDLQMRIREIFFVDQLQLNIGPQMTATEVMQRTEEKLRLMGPVVGRAENELLSPLIIRCFGILMRAGKFDTPPEELMQPGVKLRIVYTSPIAKAQQQVEANNLTRAMQVLTPFLSFDPAAMDKFNTDKTVEGVCDMYSINPEYLRDDSETAEVRQARAEAQQQAQMAEQIKNAGIGMNNIASGMDTLGQMEQ